MLKILQALFWASLGGFIVTQFIVSFVISPSDNDLAVYNLYDHLIPYTVFLAVGVLLFGAGFIITKMIKRKT